MRTATLMQSLFARQDGTGFLSHVSRQSEEALAYFKHTMARYATHVLQGVVTICADSCSGSTTLATGAMQFQPRACERLQPVNSPAGLAAVQDLLGHLKS
jgi:hypothetical protein